MILLRLIESKKAMPSISEASPGAAEDDDEAGEEGEEGDMSGGIDDMLDEALDVSGSTANDEGPTPPKQRRGGGGGGLSPTQSAASWEYSTPVGTNVKVNT